VIARRQAAGALWAIVLCVLAPSAAASAPATSGVATGGVTQTRHYVSTDGSVVADDASTYRGTLSFTFRVRPNGTITGTGTGHYVAVSWHETGTIDGASFSCDAPKTAQPFAVTVGGHVAAGVVHLSLGIPKATEVLAANVQCGNGHYLVAGTTSYLRDSLVAVGGAKLQFRSGRSVVLHPTKHVEMTAAAAAPTAPGTFHVVQQHSWTIEIKGG